MDVDELAPENDERFGYKKQKLNVTVPAKHGAAGGRVAVVPPKPRSTWASTVQIGKATVAAPSPITPRHRDAAATGVPSIFVTPRHRVGVIGKPSTPLTPRTSSTARVSAPTVYSQARQLFARSTEPGRLVGRDDERGELNSFISTCIKRTASGCLYVSGPPGTGKSALVAEVCRELDLGDTCTQSYVNCMSVKHARDIYAKMFEDLSAGGGVLRGSEGSSLRDLFFAGKHSYLVVLDEIDHLRDVDQELLYKLFEWSMTASSSLVLIGIANALDFTDRFLPRLKSRGLKPDLLPFMPYNAAQIAAVITGKLKALLPAEASNECPPFIQPAGIQFLSKKVASAAGDLRRAFDICRRAIDLIETETWEKELCKQSELTPDATPTTTPTRTPLSENINLSSPASSMQTPRKLATYASPVKQQAGNGDVLRYLTIATAPRATIAHLARVTAAVFNNGTAQRLQGLNLQQKAVLCALVGLEERNRQRVAEAASAATEVDPDTPSRRGRKPNAATILNSVTAAPTVKTLYELYASACRKENLLHPLTSTEFGDVVAGLETLSLVSAVEGKGGMSISKGPGSSARKGRVSAFGTPTGRKGVEDRRLASSVGNKDVRTMIESVKVGRGILEGMLDGGDSR